MNRYYAQDEQLYQSVNNLMAGDYDSYYVMYDLSIKYIYKIIYDIVKDYHTTEDLVQETYLTIYNKINTLQNPRAFYSWAGRIATNLALRYIQTHRRELLALDSEEVSSEFMYDMATQDVEEFIPESILMNREKQRLIAQIVDGLSEVQKITVQYFYYEDMSVKEIAEVMGCSVGVVKNRLNFARKAIKAVVIDLAENQDTRLYSLSAVPLFLLVFRQAVEEFVFAGATVGAVAVGADVATSGFAVGGEVAGVGATATASGTTAGASVGGAVASNVGTGLLGKLGASIGAKIAIGIAATSVVVVGGVAVHNVVTEDKKEDVTTEEIVEATMTDSYETEIATTEAQADFNEGYYARRYEYWENISNTESMSEELKKLFSEGLLDYDAAITAKSEDDCEICEENMESLYAQLKDYQVIEASDAKLRYIYSTAVYLMYYPNQSGWTLPDGTNMAYDYNPEYIEWDNYAVDDFDSDGNLELYIWITLACTSNSTMSHFVYEYDLNTNHWIKQYEMKGSEGPVQFFDNGTLWFGSSRSSTLEHTWIGDVYQINNNTKVYDKVYSLYRRNETTYYLVDRDGNIAYDYIDRAQLEELLYGLVGNTLELVYNSIENAPYLEDKLEYFNHIWAVNDVTGQEGHVDIGEEFILNLRDKEKIYKKIEVLGGYTQIEGMVTHYCCDGRDIIEWEDEVSLNYTLNENYNNSVSIFGVYPGMSQEEAITNFELHGLTYYKQESNVIYYVSDRSLSGGCATIVVDNGVVSRVSVGGWYS